MPTSDLDKRINNETDIRFYASTGHMEKLDPNNPADKALIPVWLQIHDTVKAQVANGTIAWTGDPSHAVAPSGSPSGAAPEIAMPDDFVGKPPGHAPTVVLPKPATPPTATAPAPSVGTGAPPIMTAQHPHAHPTAAHPAAPAVRPSIDPATQKQLYAETNARFWLQTGYRPGQKLDAKKPADAAMIPIWTDIYKKVELEYRNGTLQLTHAAPPVQEAITQAHAQSAEAADHIASATAATAIGDAQGAAQHMAAAQDHIAQAGAHSHAGAQHQPPTASPELVHHGAHTVQQFVMNGGVGVPVGAPQVLADPGDAVAIQQAQNAGGIATTVASSAPPEQTAPETAPLPTFGPTAQELTKKTGEKARKSWGAPLAIGLGVAAALGLGALAFSHRDRVRTVFARRAPRRQLAAG